MQNDIARTLVTTAAITPDALTDALFHATTRGIPLARAVIDVGVLDECRLEEELDRRGEPPLSYVIASEVAIDALPPGLVERLYCIPLADPAYAGESDRGSGVSLVSLTEGEGAENETGSAVRPRFHGCQLRPNLCRTVLGDALEVRLAVVDVDDGHAAEEVAFHLGVRVTPVRATLTAIEGALSRLRSRRISALPQTVRTRANSEPPSRLRIPSAWSGHEVARESGVSAAESSSRALETFVTQSPSFGPLQTLTRGEPFRTGNTPPYPFGELEALDEIQHHRLLAPRVPALSTLFPEVDELPGEGEDEDEEPIPLSRPARSKTPAQLPAVPFPEVGALFMAIRTATDRDIVFDLLIAAMRTIARRVALFLVKGDQLVGFRCSSLFGDERALRRISFRLTSPDMLLRDNDGEPFVGPFVASPFVAAIGGDDDSTADARVAEVAHELDLYQRDVAVATLRLDDTPAVVLLADHLSDPLHASRRLADFASVASASLARILHARR